MFLKAITNSSSCLGTNARYGCLTGGLSPQCPAASGFCELGVQWQILENKDMKTALSMPKGMTGVFIAKVEPLFDAFKVLQPGDVLTHFNGVEIADDGTFLFREAVRIDFRHLVSQAYHGDVAQVSIFLAVLPDRSTESFMCRLLIERGLRDG
jgi:hypothetical protein